MKDWFQVENNHEILSPSLLFYPDVIKSNIEKMIQVAGSTKRLRPHVKTYKCTEVVQMQLDAGISKFKCATLAEADMLAKMNVQDILIAYPLVGPMQNKFIQLSEKYSKTKFAVVIDHIDQLNQWKTCKPTSLNLYIDYDAGMGRTGAKANKVISLYKAIKKNFIFTGLHIYDGHIINHDREVRKKNVDTYFEEVDNLIKQIKNDSAGKNIEIICGGSITFPVHAAYPNRILSPGTTLLWDHGYTTNFPDIDFDIAATVLTRIISKPSEDHICLDLGYKAIASEMAETRVFFPQLKNAKRVGHSEEHLVLKVKNANTLKIGTVLYGIPWHICPTVALYQNANIIRKNTLVDQWEISARNRLLN